MSAGKKATFFYLIRHSAYFQFLESMFAVLFLIMYYYFFHTHFELGLNHKFYRIIFDLLLFYCFPSGSAMHIICWRTFLIETCWFWILCERWMSQINIILYFLPIAVNQMKKISQEFGTANKTNRMKKVYGKNDRKSKSFQEFMGFVWWWWWFGLFYSPFFSQPPFNIGYFNILIISFSLCQKIIETMMNEYLLCINFVQSLHIDAETNKRRKKPFHKIFNRN